MSIAALIAAAALRAADVQLDPQTGLWFPPYATKAQYLNRDPEHPLMRDVNRAFSENSALANDVCGAFLAAPEPKSAEINDPSVRQFRAMFSMACAGHAASVRKGNEHEAHTATALTTLQRMFEREQQSAATMPMDRRVARANELLGTIDLDNGSGPALRMALQAIALDPSATFSIHALLVLPDRRLVDDNSGVTHAQAAAFIEQLYRTHAASTSEDAWRWKAGLPAALLFTGKLDDARTAAADWLAAAPRDRASYARVMLAVIDRAHGQEGALDKVTAGCVPSAAYKEANPDAPAADYCMKAAVYLVINALESGREQAPHGLADAAFDLARLNVDDWPTKLTLVSSASQIDPRGVQKRLYAMLAERDMPTAAQHDAFLYLSEIAERQDPVRVAPLVDCFLHSMEIDLPAASPETWKRLAGMPAGTGSPPADCKSMSPNSWCVMHALARRLRAAEAIKNWNLARQTIEKFAVITVLSGGNADSMRNELASFANDEMLAGRRADAVGILSYLKGQPDTSYVASELARSADIPARATAPWSSPVAVDHALLSTTCPPPPPPD